VPLIATLPERGRAERICVSLGPGSFTGVRIGLAAARALGLAWRAQVLGFPTLALVAAMAQQRVPGPVSVAMLGGHGEWFVQDYGEAGHAEGALASLAPGEAARLAAHAQVAGSAAEPLVALRGHGTAHPLLPDARSLPLLDDKLLTRALAPLYGRAPDARVQVPAGQAT
jgi:tRNA threonylcarbamoyl adenosine modification protein YeaZ